MNKIILLWKFSRPHTLIGTFVSVTAILFVAAGGQLPGPEVWDDYLITLCAALCCNIYITGLNQWSDAEVDRINKPWLPLPAGLLSPAAALKIVLICLLLSLILSACLSAFFFSLVGGIALLGTIYSLPPFKWKRNHFLAAGTITLVRGILVNIGFYIHYKMIFRLPVFPDTTILLLTFFVVLFSIGIAWFKDIPDTEGDQKFRFGTLAVLIGKKATLQLGVAIVSTAYLSMILAAILHLLPNANYYILVHAFCLVLFFGAVFILDLSDAKSIKRFYLFYWILFFAEYVLFPAGLFLQV